MLDIQGQTTVLLLGTTTIVVLLALMAMQRLERGLPRHRLARVGRVGTQPSKPAADLPSIARRQYGFMKRSKAAGTRHSLVSLLEWLDRLIRSSGVPISLGSLGIVVLLSAIVMTAIVHRITGIGLALVAVIVVPLVAGLAVQLLVRRKAAQLRRFQSVFPEALDLIVRSVRAGLPVSEAIRMIGTEVAEPVGAAFREVGANLAIGLSLEDALALLERKVPIPEVKFFVISLTIQQETGGNLAEILSNLASIMRKRVQIGKKIRALSSEARASALIIGSLPFIVGIIIFMMNRQYIEILFIDEVGRWYLAGAMASIATGAVVMAKLIRFEI
jgi:tight adherence protein B